jgi:serine/threonine protein kinase
MSGYNNVIDGEDIPTSYPQKNGISDLKSASFSGSATPPDITPLPSILSHSAELHLSNDLTSFSGLITKPDFISNEVRNKLFTFFSEHVNFENEELSRSHYLEFYNEIEGIIQQEHPNIKINFDCSIACRRSRHDQNKPVYNVLISGNAGQNGVVKFPLMQAKKNDTGEWIYKTYNDKTRQKIAKKMLTPPQAMLKATSVKVFQEIKNDLDKIEKSLPPKDNEQVKINNAKLNEIRKNLNTYTKHATFLYLCEQEANLTKRLFAEEGEEHPKKFHFLRSANMFFMPYIRGKTLDKFIKTGEINGNEINYFNIFTELHKQLMALHEKNIVHRDLRPDNVMVDDEHNVSIIDLGLAGEVDKPCPPMINYVCMAPELYDSGGVAKFKKSVNLHEQDIYALGLIFCAMYGAKQRNWVVVESKDEKIADNENDFWLVLDDETRCEVEVIAEKIKELTNKNALSKELITAGNDDLTKNVVCDSSSLKSKIPSQKVKEFNLQDNTLSSSSDDCASVSSNNEAYYSVLDDVSSECSSLANSVADSQNLSNSSTVVTNPPSPNINSDCKSLKQFLSQSSSLNNPSTSTALHAEANLLAPNYGQSVTTSKLINTSYSNAPLKIVGVETPGFLQNSQLPTNIQSQLYELRHGLLDINPATRLNHKQITEKIKKISDAFIAYEEQQQSKMQSGRHKQQLL